MSNFHEAVERLREEILATWAAEAGQLAAARGLSRPELMNIMPKYLISLAALDEARADRRRQIENHLSSRLREGYQLDEVLEELAILGRCVARRYTAEGVVGELDLDALAQLYDALHEDASVVISAFTQHLLGDEQVEKRYLRRLQTLATEALREDPSGPAREARLKAVLELVMEAMGAQSAAILFYDLHHKALWMAASVGLADEPLGRYLTESVVPSFVDAVAAHEEETTALEDVVTSELAVSDALRRSGIRGLLGVRLPTRHELVGVMYVGLAEQRPFSPREVRRLETLGEQLALHLDRARLYDQLRAHIDELRVERGLREQFISVLAHDLRGPLAVVQTSVHLLCKDAERLGDHAELPGRALRNVKRADRMVCDLLDVLRVRAGHGLPLTLAACDLAALAQEVVEELTLLHGARFVLRCAGDARGVWSADTVQRALWNLATNAVKYGGADTPILVNVRRVAERVEVVVHNDGEVIPLLIQSALFKPFAQFPLGEAGERLGWGLGLTLVRACAEAHGGAVGVESAAGVGTTFTIKLPLDARPFQSDA